MTENKFFFWPPTSLLFLKGKLDARKGPSAVSAYIDKIRQRLAALTAQEVMEVEKALQKTRQETSGRLVERNRILERLAALSSVQEEDCAAAIRANRRDAEERDCLWTALADCEEAILVANETLINTQALLGERLVRLQALTQERISLYIMGIRSSRGLKAFTCSLPENETHALDECLAGHQTLDSEVRRVAEELMRRKEAA